MALPTLPVEVWENIAFFTVDPYHLHRSSLARSIESPDPGRLPWDRRWLASYGLLCHNAYAGIASVLWQHVVISTPLALRRVVHVVEHGLALDPRRRIGRVARRLDLRMTQGYDPKPVAKLMRRMRQLRIVVIANRVPISRGLTGRSLTLLFKPLITLERLHLCSFHESPTFGQLVSLTASVPTLQTLQVARIRPERHPKKAPLLSSPSLSTLWVGSHRRTTWAYPPAGQDLLQSMATLPPGLPSMVRLDVLGDSGHLEDFLTVYGRQLSTLHISSRDRLFASPRLAILCPNLESIRIEAESSHHLNPAPHPRVKRVQIVIDPAVVGHIPPGSHRHEQLQRRLGKAVVNLTEDFPAIRFIEVEQCGTQVNPEHHFFVRASGNNGDEKVRVTYRQ